MKEKLLLVLIIILAVFLRFWEIETIPPSLSWDEVAIGYNAYSVLKTGKDEYGTSYPLLFRSFDDSKLPGLIYLTSVSEVIFGLNEFGVRFPSAFFGILTVLIAYFVVREILEEKSALFATLLFAINPWLINFSRQAFETNVSMSFFSLGILFLVKAIRKRTMLVLSFAFFAVSIYFYYAARIVVPFFILAFVTVNFNWFRKNFKIFLISGIIFIILLAPLIEPIFSTKGFSRINQVAITNEPYYLALKENYAKLILDHDNVWWAKIVYNRRIAFFQTWFLNYVKNTSFEYLFVNGAGNTGLLYFWELPFFLLGFYALAVRREKWKYVILFWFVLSIIPASFTKDQPNPLRTLIGAPSLVLISFFGIKKAWEIAVLKKKTQIFSVVLFMMITASLVQFCFLYFEYAPKERAIDFGDGYKQLVQSLVKERKNYDLIYISGAYWRPYIHLLFHLKYDPMLYQANGTKDGFDKFRFGKASWDSDGIDLQGADLASLAPKEKKVLFVFSKKEFAGKIDPRINFAEAWPINGLYAKEVFWAFEYNDYLRYLNLVKETKEQNAF